MGRLGSPAIVFGLATLLLTLPAIPRLFEHHPDPAISFRLSPRAHTSSNYPVTQPPARSLIPVHTTSTVRVVRHLPSSLVGMILSGFPIFAIVYGAWPRYHKRPLDLKLGGWHVALATVPLVAMPLAPFLVLALATPLISTAFLKSSPPHMDVLITTLPTLLTIVPVIVGILWLAGLGLLALNIRRTLKDEMHPAD